MPSPKVTEWANCNLRYVAEAKLARLDDADLLIFRPDQPDRADADHVVYAGPLDGAGITKEVSASDESFSDLVAAVPESPAAATIGAGGLRSGLINAPIHGADI